jgi:hypothetical protein
MRRLAAAALVCGVVLGVFAGSGAAERPKAWLWQCEQIHLAVAKFECDVRLLLEEIDASGDPARHLPLMDVKARTAGDALEGGCHALMHEVGRRFAREHHVTLSTLQDYIPRSNDPTCSAGFGMGLVMALGPQLLRPGGGASALETCLRLPTRYRSYTCVHGLGHALMRGFHGDLELTVGACRKLRVYSADCAQGAFHDYWIALRGADGTERLTGVATSPRSVCNGRFFFVRGCWYRYFLEQPGRPAARTPADVVRPCGALRPLQRSGCVAGVAVTIEGDALQQLAVCRQLRAVDAASCLRGAAVQGYAGRPAAQARLLRSCARFASGARAACYSWLGRTLAVVTDGRFSCAAAERASSRAACRGGASHARDALFTFS